jgi:hypothetical protein
MIVLETTRPIGKVTVRRLTHPGWLSTGDPIYVAFPGEEKLNHRGFVRDFGSDGSNVLLVRGFHDDLGQWHLATSEGVTWQKGWEPSPGSPADVARKRLVELRRAGVATCRSRFSHGGGI